MQGQDSPAMKKSWIARVFGFDEINEEPLSELEIKKQYERPPAFINQIPITNFDPELESFVFADDISVGAVIEIMPIDAEARPLETIEKYLDDIENAFSILPERDKNPWVIQQFLSNEPLESLYGEIEQYMNSKSPEINPVRDNYLKILKEHLHIVGREEGIFLDTKAGVRWSGTFRRARLVIYRKFNPKNWPNRNGQMPGDELNRVIKSITSGLLEANIQSFRYHASDVYEWLYPWFNPAPRGFESSYDYLEKCKPSKEALEWDCDLPAAIIQNTPLNENKNWYFDGKPHRYIPIVHFNESPRPGLITLEKPTDKNNAASLFDRLPAGSIYTTTIVIEPQDILRAHLNEIAERSTGKNAASKNARIDAADCIDALEKHKMVTASMGVFLRAADDRQMEDRIDKVFAILNIEKLQAVHPDHDLMVYNSYVNNLPFSFRPEYDTFLRRSKLQWTRNILAASPFFGQAMGTPHPGFLFFNRSGQPVKLDMLNKQDREMSAHMLMFGPTGAGKSATGVALLMQAIANYMPHIYIIDVGDSFRLLGDYCENLGLKVRYVRLDQATTPVPPFASSSRMLVEQEYYKLSDDDREELIAQQKKDKNRRNFMSEMESAAKLIITGGDEREIKSFRRHDLSIVRAAIKHASMAAFDSDRPHALIDDFIDAFDAFLTGAIPPGYKTAISKDSKKRIEEMRDSARLFCDGIRGELFNQYGEGLEEADVTIIDMGRIAMDEDMKDIMNLAFIGAMNTIQSDAEQRRGKGRQSIVTIDEAHVLTTNPLTANYLAKGAKMWRKWGLWLWMLTQNPSDFPDTSKKILNMAEFWFCLKMPKEEVEDIVKRFKKLTVEEQALLMGVRKESGKFAEGVVLSSKNNPLLIRMIPPGLVLALAQTEEKEVEERFEVMKKFDLKTELEGCYKIAESINQNRLQEHHEID